MLFMISWSGCRAFLPAPHLRIQRHSCRKNFLGGPDTYWTLWLPDDRNNKAEILKWTGSLDKSLYKVFIVYSGQNVLGEEQNMGVIKITFTEVPR